MLEQPFILNHIYRRQSIHDQFGGNRQNGISVSAKAPFIFIFSGKAGHQHGYKDQWENPDVFSYTGEGQVNDMQFVRGNLALRDHLATAKRIFLFTDAGIRSHVRFETELQLREFDFFVTPDRDGNQRTAIKFFFQRVGKSLEYPIVEQANTYEAELDKILNWQKPNQTERSGLVTSRVGQGAYRKSVLYRWEFQCAVTGYRKKEILIASHIVPWKDANDEQRLDVDNGILLSPTFDALFDKHLISFENSGKIILSDALRETNYENLGVSGKETISRLNNGNQWYLDQHRSQLAIKPN
ncbi:MAG: hypothetical protein EOO16_16390 [Chitinophagaceae bacterium]|nr:MAG: hypothetical protein EOO16_16390 [Chitinophagaceae bacterium]